MRRVRAVLVFAVLAAACLRGAEETPKETAKKALPEAKTGKKYEKPQIERFWASAEYVALWTKDQPAPGFPLATVGSLASPTGGRLGDPSTRILYDPDDTNFGITHGVQARIGAWLDQDRKWGVEAEGFWSPRQHENKNVPIVPGPGEIAGTPYFNVRNNAEDLAFQISVPQSVNMKAERDQEIWSAGIKGLRDFHRGEHWDLAASAGFKYVSLEDEYALHYIELNSGVLTLFGVDRFQTANRFYGAEFGLRALYHSGRFHAEISPRLALGANREELDINGSLQIFAGPGVGSAAPGAIFTQPGTNIGSHDRVRLGVIPGIDLKAGVDITKRLEFNAGLAFSYWQSVVRAGNQLDRRINPSFAFGSPIPRQGPAVPAVRFRTDDFWTLGLTAGFKVKF